MVHTITTGRMSKWRPLYWEPVAGTGERLMVGVLHCWQNEIGATRVIRDDVLDCLFGKSASGIKRLIDHALATYKAAAEATKDVTVLDMPLLGLHPGPMRETEAHSVGEVLQTAALLYSSLGNLDKLDEAEDTDVPQSDDVNRRFGTEVRDVVLRTRPDLHKHFNVTGKLVPGGQPVRFGFLSPKAALHFTVLHPVRQNPSVRDARAKIFELQRVREVAGIPHAALIAAVPRSDDVTLGSKQREQLRINREEIEQEADAVNLRWHAVHTAVEGAEKLLELA